MASSEESAFEEQWMPREEVLGGLPGPLEEEPESLRKDIADELQDHLLSSLAQERQRTVDVELAEQNVLDRFGDVRQVARRLWFDWMKGKIMTQRLTLATTLLTAFALIGVCVLGWNLVQQNREFNSELLEKLSAMAVKPAPEVEVNTSEVSDVSVLLARGTNPPYPPAIGYSAQLTSSNLNLNERRSFTTKSDVDGRLFFERVMPGEYDLAVTTPTGEILRSNIEINKKSSRSYRFRCPEDRLQFSKVKFKINWPEDLDNKGLITILNFETQREQDEDWKRENLPFRFHLLLKDSDLIWHKIAQDELYWLSKNGRVPYPQYREFAQAQELDVIEFSELYVTDDEEIHAAIDLAQRNYYLKGIDIALSPEMIQAEMEKYHPEKTDRFLMKLIGSHVYESRSKEGGGFGGRRGNQTELNKSCPLFTVSEEEEQTWTVELPEELLEQVREALSRKEI